jgi:imidazolonepropionase-like amidohydrolase
MNHHSSSMPPRRPPRSGASLLRKPWIQGLLAASVLVSLVASRVRADEAPIPSVTVAAQRSQTFVVRNARVFDGLHVVTATDVFVQRGVIKAVGKKLAVPAGVTPIDGTGRTLLPCLIDAHTHSYLTARRDALRFGVTTELDMFGDYHQIASAKRDRERLDPVDQADLWSAGTLATAPHGHGTEYGFPIPTLTTPAEAPAFVQARFNEGSDYLKIILEDGSAYGQTIATLDAATAKALVAEAHVEHKLAVAHVATEAEAVDAIDAHIDGLAHVFMDRVASDDVVKRIRRSGAWVVATLSVAAASGRTEDARELVADPLLHPWLTSGQTSALNTRFPPKFERQALFTNALQNVKLLHAAGVPILAGTDAGNPGTAHGVSMHGEMELLVRAGLTPSEALSAATMLPAVKFKLGDRGRIAPGMRADLLLVEGDPTVDIKATRAIVAIWKNGAVVDRALNATERADLTKGSAAPADPMIADFEDGKIAVRFGQSWSITTDALAGGKSSARQEWIDASANGSKGALRVSGEVAPGLPYAWAGTLFMPGAEPFAPVDFSARKTLVFKVRGEGRPLTAMIFSGSATSRMPATVAFDTTTQWSEVRIELQRFDGADFTRLRGLAFTAGVPAGPFAFEIDDIRVE